MSDAATWSHPLPHGSTVGHYRIVAQIGGGGMGVVYAAEDLALGRPVALKFLPGGALADPQAVRRFRREAQAASSLNHPNICTIYAVDEADGQPFIAMELLEGETLERRTSTAPLDLEQTLDLGIQIAEALEAAHEAGLVHRDITPANIFVTSRGRAKVLDFGLAKNRQTRSATAQTTSTLTLDGVAMGTLPYMSPEQVKGRELDARTDLFSFGAVLFRMATGVSPFRGVSPGDVCDALLHLKPPSPARLNPVVPAELERIIDKALEKDRDLRYQHAADMCADLKRLRQSMASGRQDTGTVSEPRRGHALRGRWSLAVVVAMLVIGAAAAAFLYSRRPLPLTEKDSVVLADFENRTADPIFDETLKEALSADLQQSPFLNVLSDRRQRALLKLMGRAPNERVNEDTARDLCQRAGSKAVLAGSIASIGRHYVIDVHATNCATGDSIGREEREASRKEDVLKALDQAASGLRSRLGESLASVRAFDTPIEEATTTSLDALRAYSEGIRARWEKTDVEAIPLLQRAIELDSDFAWAYLQLAVSHSNLGESAAAARYAAAAYKLRERTSERERCTISADYYLFVTGELDKEIAAWNACARTYPRYFIAPLSLGVAYSYLGQYEQSLAANRDALRLEPTDGNLYGNVMNALVALGRLDEAKATYRQATERRVDNAGVHLLRYEVAFLEGDTGEMQRQVGWSDAKPGVEGAFSSLQSFTDASSGRVTSARELSERAVDAAERTGQQETAGEWLAARALWEAEFGYEAAARNESATALRLSATRDVQIPVALAFARSGRADEAQSLADRLAARYPTNTALNVYWLPVIRAGIALARREPAKAIAVLRPAAQYDLAMPPPYIERAYPIYLRGLAYLLLRDGVHAVGEFENLLKQRTVCTNSPLMPLARLWLGRAFAMTGDTQKARQAYQDFLQAWKQADPSVPLLQHARAEFARLK